MQDSALLDYIRKELLDAFIDELKLQLPAFNADMLKASLHRR